MTSLSGCVIPVSPQFEGPLPQENFAPQIESAQPAQGQVLTAGTAQSFTITVTDPNAGDDLNIRWIAEYPPFTNITRRLMDQPVFHSADGERLHAPVKITISCAFYPLASIASHTIMALVSDRPFRDVPDQPDAGTTALELENALTGVGAGNKAEAHWFLNLPCQMPQP